MAVVMNRPWLPEHHHHDHHMNRNGPLMAPGAALGASRHAHSHSHKQLNFYIGIVLVAFMAVSVVALICCCYHLEWRLRLQARNAARRGSNRNAARRGSNMRGANVGSHDEMVTRVGKKTKQETNLSVMMPGDSIPSFLAKAKPHGSSSDLLVSETKDASSKYIIR